MRRATARRVRALRACAAIAAAALVGCAEHVGRQDLAARIAAGDPPPIIDLRSSGEYTTSHVPGAVHIPFYAVLAERERIPSSEDRPAVLYCEHGPRAGLARAQLWLAGVGPLRFLEGHMTAWKRDGLPVETGPARSEAQPGG